jgi:hypothetical protein
MKFWWRLLKPEQDDQHRKTGAKLIQVIFVQYSAHKDKLVNELVLICLSVTSRRSNGTKILLRSKDQLLGFRQSEKVFAQTK